MDMLEIEGKQRFVLVVTNTSQSEAIAQWTEELTRRNCRVQVTSIDGFWDIVVGQQVDGILLDDVDPGSVAEAERLLRVVLAWHPMPRVVLLASPSKEVVQGLADNYGKHPNVLIHQHEQPMADCYSYLAGEGVADNMPTKRAALPAL
jgi:hypothetical protein